MILRIFVKEMFSFHICKWVYCLLLIMWHKVELSFTSNTVELNTKHLIINNNSNYNEPLMFEYEKSIIKIIESEPC